MKKANTSVSVFFLLIFFSLNTMAEHLNIEKSILNINTPTQHIELELPKDLKLEYKENKFSGILSNPQVTFCMYIYPGQDKNKESHSFEQLIPDEFNKLNMSEKHLKFIDVKKTNINGWQGYKAQVSNPKTEHLGFVLAFYNHDYKIFVFVESPDTKIAETVVERIKNSLRILDVAKTINFSLEDIKWEMELPYPMSYKIEHHKNKMITITAITANNMELSLFSAPTSNIDDANTRYQEGKKFHLKRGWIPVYNRELSLGVWQSTFYKKNQLQDQEFLGILIYRKTVFAISLPTENEIMDQDIEMCKTIVKSIREVPKSK